MVRCLEGTAHFWYGVLCACVIRHLHGAVLTQHVRGGAAHAVPLSGTDDHLVMEIVI